MTVVLVDQFDYKLAHSVLQVVGTVVYASFLEALLGPGPKSFDWIGPRRVRSVEHKCDSMLFAEVLNITRAMHGQIINHHFTFSPSRMRD